MKIYLASSFDLVTETEHASGYLEAKGHVITVKWWSADRVDICEKKADLGSDDFYDDPLCEVIFLKDVKGVRDADALVLVGGDPPIKFNGANVELGMAYALGKPCFSVGHTVHSAMYYPVKRCRNLGELALELTMFENSKAVPRPAVRRFAEKMEYKLSLHDDRPGWLNLDPEWLLKRLREETDELERAMKEKRSDWAEKACLETADVANFSMMICDVLSHRRSPEDDMSDYGSGKIREARDD